MNSALRFLIPLILLASVSSGCSERPDSDSSQPASAETTGRLFGASFQTMNNPFFVDLGAGLKHELEASGDRLVILDAQFNSLKQKNDICESGQLGRPQRVIA